MDETEILAKFERLLTEVTDRGSSSIESLLQVVDEETAHLIRLAAIPHQLTLTLLCVLAPDIAEEAAEEHLEELANYSFFIPDSNGVALHDQTRRELFEWWLNKGDAAEFTLANTRLAEHFTRELSKYSEDDGEVYETLLRQRMYHLLGADQHAGFAVFEGLSRRARYQHRSSECATLAKLVHDYDPVLTPESRAWLAYHEGKLAVDLKQAERAGALLDSVLNAPGAPLLARAAALMRLGQLHHSAWQLDEAERFYTQSLEIAESNDEARRLLPRVKHDLGALYRDRKDYDRACDSLYDARELASKFGNRYICATILNSLGRLYLDQRQIDMAIKTFQESCAELEITGEQSGLASVCSNLGNAYLELGDLEESYSLFERSLKLSQDAGDTLAQANTLNNMARVLRAQNKTEEAADVLSRAVILFQDVHSNFEAAVALQNRARSYRRLGKLDLAETSLHEAEALFHSEGADDKVAEVIAEIATLHRKRGLPWWLWVCIAFSGLPFVLFVVLIFVLILFHKL